MHKKTKSGKTMNLILLIVAVAAFAFTVKMIKVFELTGSEPSTLETCVFGLLGGECGILGWIKTTKEKKRDREWQLQDRDREDKKQSKEE